MKGKNRAKTIAIIALAILSIANVIMPIEEAYAQPEVEWEKTFGGSLWDYGSSVQQTTDGGYIIAGYTESFGAGNGDVYLIKTDSNGNIVWDRTFGGYPPDEGYFAQQTTDGGYVITGLTYTGYNVYLIKTDSNGNSVWEKTFGDNMREYGNSVQQTTDGGYVLVGVTESFGAGMFDVYLVKTDSNGNKQWEKTFGGSEDDEGVSVKQAADGGYIMAGYTESFGAGNGDVYLIKTDSEGNEIWSRIFGGIEHDTGRSVQQTADGGYIIAGYTESFGGGNSDVYLIKTDSDGVEDWSKTFDRSKYQIIQVLRMMSLN